MITFYFWVVPWVLYIVSMGTAIHFFAAKEKQHCCPRSGGDCLFQMEQNMHFSALFILVVWNVTFWAPEGGPLIVCVDQSPVLARAKHCLDRIDMGNMCFSAMDGLGVWASDQSTQEVHFSPGFVLPCMLALAVFLFFESVGFLLRPGSLFWRFLGVIKVRKGGLFP